MECAILCTAGIADAQVRLQQARGAIQGAQRQVQEGMLQRQEAAAQQRLQRVRRLRAYSPLLAQPHLKVGTPSCTVMGCSHELQWVACCRGGRQLRSHGLSVCCLPADVVLPPPPQAAFDAHPSRAGCAHSAASLTASFLSSAYMELCIAVGCLGCMPTAQASCSDLSMGWAKGDNTCGLICSVWSAVAR